MDWINSEYKFIFAEKFLDDFLNLDPASDKYKNKINIDAFGILDTTTDISIINTTSPVEVDTRAILHDLNRYVESYIFFAKSSLDIVAREVFLNLNILVLDKKRKPKEKIYFYDLINNIDDIEKINSRISMNIKEFYKDPDYKNFNNCRRKISHETILKIDCAFKKNEGIGKVAHYELMRPIPLPPMLKKYENEISLDEWLKNINKKIKNFLNELKK